MKEYIIHLNYTKNKVNRKKKKLWLETRPVLSPLPSPSLPIRVVGPFLLLRGGSGFA